MSLLSPYKMFHRVTDITPDFLRENGISGIALDADNTLSTHHSQQPADGVKEWLGAMRDAGIKLVMVSNAKRPRVEPFAKKLGLDFVCIAMKPLPFGFIRAKRRMGLRSKQMAAVGDQLYTDMIGAHLAGVKPLLVEPILTEDGPSFKVRRRLERRHVEKYRRNKL